MRGKLDTPAEETETDRITPADAGKTDVIVKQMARFEDHPRGCGENFTRQRGHVLQPGSPPRMRGKLGAGAYHFATDRITPADAGKTDGNRV